MEQPALPHADPCVVVIFGATGDLTKRKLMPALFDLCRLGCLDAGAHPWRRHGTRCQRTSIANSCATRSTIRKTLAKFDEHVWGEFRRAHSLPDRRARRRDERIKTISSRLEELAANGASKNRLFYLATPPSLFDEIVNGLGRSGLAKEEEGSWSRIVVEKPFGSDLESAKALNATMAQVFQESSGLSHRSLSRQRYGAKHPRLSFWQLDVRACLESQLRRLRRDHGGGIRRRRHARRLLRRSGRVARHGCESSCCNC